MSNEVRGPDPLSAFWSPLCAIGSHGARPNAQVCVAVSGASIVPRYPRITVTLWRENYTHDLVESAGTLAVTLLAAGQLDLLEPLGLESGRERDKLAGIQHELTADGDPWFPGGVAWLRCEVIAAHDLGDATAFLCAVHERTRLSEVPPLTWAEARTQVSSGFLRRWDEKSARDRESASRTLRWLP